MLGSALRLGRQVGDPLVVILALCGLLLLAMLVLGCGAALRWPTAAAARARIDATLPGRRWRR